MLADRRYDEILRLLTQRGSLALRDIVTELGISEATARRDVTRLADDGRLTRVYGGAVPLGTDEVPFALSDTTDRAEKAEIARAAAAMVRDGDTVILDIGSSVLELARALSGREITVVTGNMMAYEVLKDRSSTELILLGGLVRRNYWATSGPLAIGALASIQADIAFLGTSGIAATGRVLDTTAVDVPIKQQMMASAHRAVLLATERKFPGEGRYVVCEAAAFDTIITTARTPQAHLDALAKHDVAVVRVDA